MVRRSCCPSFARRCVGVCAPGVPPRRLTSDGNNDKVARSATGRLLIQSRRESDGYVIMLFEPGATTPTLTTPGPRDATPAFSRRRRLVLYPHRSARNRSLRRLEFMRGDPLRSAGPDLAGAIPRFPACRLSHVAQYAAIETSLTVQRSRARSRRGDRRCAPVWTDANHIWVLQLRAAARMDRDRSQTNRRSGRRQQAGTETADYRDCSMTERPFARALPARARGSERVVGDPRDPDAGVAMILSSAHMAASTGPAESARAA